MENSEWKGHLILVVSVSGAGKGTLISYIREVEPDLNFAVSCTSRPMRPGEVEGQTYHFLTEEAFREKIETDEFLEWIQQDGGHYYGTLKSEITDKVKAGKVVLREVEVRGARAIQKLLPEDKVTTVYITAGSWEEMAGRIKKRAPISPEELESRRQRYEREKVFADEADHIVINRDGELDAAKTQFKNLIDEIVTNVNQL